ncbi:DoxX family protein [Coprobacter sp.]
MENGLSSSVKSNRFIQMTLTFLLSECCSNAARLFLRLFIGVLMLTHGFVKIEHFDTLVDTFPNPLGLGRVTLPLIILVEVGGSILLMVGFLTRLALIPLIFSMIVAAFLTYPSFSLATSELPLLYLGIYITLLLAGPGKCSIDYLLDKAYNRK